jgi:hypothetical protein
MKKGCTDENKSGQASNLNVWDLVWINCDSFVMLPFVPVDGAECEA